MSDGEDDDNKMGEGLYSLKDKHSKSCSLQGIRRKKVVEVAVGSKEANFPIFRLWDMWTVREKADPTVECNGKNHILRAK